MGDVNRTGWPPRLPPRLKRIWYGAGGLRAGWAVLLYAAIVAAILLALGAAARIVHDGCRATLREHFTIRPVRDEAEGTRVTIGEGFDAAAIRLTGNVVGQPPFHGSISHRGWRVDAVRLPKLNPGHAASIMAPAEVAL